MPSVITTLKRGGAQMIRRMVVLMFLAVLLSATFQAQNASDSRWLFAVSGDSRNCGDAIMPAIAKSALEHKVEFYWHLGDFRLGYAIDEDMQNQAGGQLTLSEYQKKAWDDFLAQQIAPFGSLPVHLDIGIMSSIFMERPRLMTN
jgi:hypothetical protein